MTETENLAQVHGWKSIINYFEKILSLKVNEKYITALLCSAHFLEGGTR